MKAWDGFKKLIRASFGRAGLEVRRLRDPYALQKYILENEEVSVIFDVGGNQGDTTSRYRNLFPASKIHLFEIYPGYWEPLRERFRNDPDVRIVPMGLAEKKGKEKLFVSRGKSTHSLLDRPRSGATYHSPLSGIKETLSVPVTAIDDYCGDHSIENIDLLKIDVEGGESRVLKGAHGMLKQEAVSVIVMEVMFVPHYHGQPLYFDLAALLQEYGFSLFDLFNLRHAPNGQIRWGDAIFVSSRLRREVLDPQLQGKGMKK